MGFLPSTHPVRASYRVRREAATPRSPFTRVSAVASEAVSVLAATAPHHDNGHGSNHDGSSCPQGDPKTGIAALARLGVSGAFLARLLIGSLLVRVGRLRLDAPGLRSGRGRVRRG